MLEDRFCAGRPALERHGITFSDNVAAFEAAKGRMLNASHMLLAYPAILAGYRFVHDALADELFIELLENFMDRDAIPLITAPPGVSLSAYRATIIERFKNPAIRDQLLRIAHDGASKLPIFHAQTIATLVQTDGDLRREAFLLACFARYFCARDDLGVPFEVAEPQLNASDRALIAGADPLAILRTAPFRGLALSTNSRFVALFERYASSLAEAGTITTLHRLLAEP